MVRFGALLAAAVMVTSAAACTKATPPEQRPGSDARQLASGAPGSNSGPGSGGSGPARPVAAARPTVTLTGSAGPVTVSVEVVDTDPLIERGLMYRQHLPPEEGMLFVMGAEDDWRFWMRNTLIPLDILFITRDMAVAGVLENMQPLDEQSKGVGAPSLYVLEVNGGWAKAHGIGAGAKVAFERVTATGPAGGFGNQ